MLEVALATPAYELSVTASNMPGTAGGGVRCLHEYMPYVCRADLSLLCLRSCRYKGKFELTYVSKSTVVVKALSSGSRTVVSSGPRAAAGWGALQVSAAQACRPAGRAEQLHAIAAPCPIEYRLCLPTEVLTVPLPCWVGGVHAVFGYDIQKVDVYQERFIVARTQGTLMLGDLESCKLSELPWDSDLTERFFFDSDKVPLTTLVKTAASAAAAAASRHHLVQLQPHVLLSWSRCATQGASFRVRTLPVDLSGPQGWEPVRGGVRQQRGAGCVPH